jgi:hypothetical protein
MVIGHTCQQDEIDQSLHGKRQVQSMATYYMPKFTHHSIKKSPCIFSPTMTQLISVWYLPHRISMRQLCLPPRKHFCCKKLCRQFLLVPSEKSIGYRCIFVVLVTTKMVSCTFTGNIQFQPRGYVVPCGIINAIKAS